MVRFNTPIGKVKLGFKRSSTLTKVVVLLVLVLSIAALLTMTLAISAAKDQTEALYAEGQELLSEKSRLERYIEELGTIPAIIRIAQEELGLVDPDSIIIQPE